MFGDDGRRFGDFHLLQHFRSAPRKAAACRRSPGSSRACRGTKWLTASGGNGDRRCCSCPGCPPFFRFLPPLGSGFFGLTMSLDGGLEEVEEFLRAAANCCCKLAFSDSSWEIRSRASDSRRSRSARRSADGCESGPSLTSGNLMEPEITHALPATPDQNVFISSRNRRLQAEIPVNSN